MVAKSVDALKIEQHLQEWQTQIERLNRSRHPARVSAKIDHYQSLINRYQYIQASLKQSTRFPNKM